MALTHTSALGVYENLTVGSPCAGTVTSTVFQLGTWGPAVIMDGTVSILSGMAPPGIAPFVCSDGATSVLYMVGTPTLPGIYTYTTRAHLSNGSNFDVPCIQTITGLLLSPARGTRHGGTVVSVFSTGLTGVTQVTFGGTPSVSVHVLSDTSLTCITPAHAVGPVDVIVVGVGTLTAAYTYVSVDLVTPARGTVAGLQAVTVTGYGFAGATQVTFGGTRATAVVVASNTSLTALTPAHRNGIVDVTVVGVDTGIALYAYVLAGIPQTLGKTTLLPPLPSRAPFAETPS